MDSPAPTCPRHPDVETRLRCSACDTPICPACATDAVTGYKCPDCIAAERDRPEAGASGEAATSQGGGVGSWFRGASGPEGGQRSGPGELPPGATTRGTAVGLAASVVGGLMMVPILAGGTFMLVSSGVIGWLVARAVFWASAEAVSSYLRSFALVAAGATVLLGLAIGGGQELAGFQALALPAAVYGGWICVRRR